MVRTEVGGEPGTTASEEKEKGRKRGRSAFICEGKEKKIFDYFLDIQSAEREKYR